MHFQWVTLGGFALPFVLSQCAVSTQCAGYVHATVAEMRQASGSGCFELQHVVVAARTPSASTPRVYVQDVTGGPYSAIRAKCDTSPTHACPVETGRSVGSLLDGSLVTLRGYYLQGSLSGFEEMYLDDVADEQALAEAPPAARVTPAEISRDAHSRERWFQIVAADIAADDPLQIYDFSPPEFARADSCPAWAGFAVIQSSAAPALIAAGCASGGNPPSVARPDAREILIGREFFKDFYASTDCRCALLSKQHLLSASGVLTGSIRGLLIPEVTPGSSRLYQVFQPLSKAAFPISGG